MVCSDGYQLMLSSKSILETMVPEISCQSAKSMKNFAQVLLNLANAYEPNSDWIRIKQILDWNKSN